MSNLPEKNIEYNIPQLIFSLARQKHARIEGGRGVGKSFIIGDRVQKLTNELPRGKIAVVGRTYEQILTRTLPSTINGLTSLGFVKDLHFFVGNKPPKAWKWDSPFEATLSYDYAITFYNGATFQMVSLDKTESGRGFNFDAAIGDEAALLDFEKLQNNVLLSIRGNLEHFGKSYLHQSTLFVTTTPRNKRGRWFLKEEENARLYPDDVFYMIAPSRYNIKNLGKEYFKTMKRILLPSEYDAEIECLRSNGAKAPFYPTYREEKHSYFATNDNYLFKIANDIQALNQKDSRFDSDLDTTRPLHIACDYNASICWVVTGQDNVDEYRILNSQWVKAPDTIVEAIQKWCDYNRYHIKKEVHYYYDHTAVHKDALRSKTYAEAVIEVLSSNKWTVIPHYCGQAPRHDTKKLMFEVAFAEREPRQYPRIRLNRENNKQLLVILESTEAVDGRDGQKKDKSSEKPNSDVPDEEATHGGDAFDTLVYFKFSQITKGVGGFIHAVA
jgi:hypothetical protein